MAASACGDGVRIRPSRIMNTRQSRQKADLAGRNVDVGSMVAFLVSTGLENIALLKGDVQAHCLVIDLVCELYCIRRNVDVQARLILPV